MFCISFSKSCQAALFGGIQLQLHLFDVQQLLLQLGAALGDLRHKGVQLLVVAMHRVVQLDQFLALGELETDAFAAQDQL